MTASKSSVNTIDDDEPFAAEGAFTSELARLTVGEHAGLGMEADQKRRFRLKVEAWARGHGLWSADGSIAAASSEGGVVTAALYEMTEETVVLRGTAPAAAAVTITVEPANRSWTGRLAAAFAKKPAKTGDARFDDRFDVRTTDESSMRQILGAELRAELLEMDAWCVLSYAEGRIELRVDAPRLAGAHVLAGIDIVETTARSRVAKSAYR